MHGLKLPFLKLRIWSANSFEVFVTTTPFDDVEHSDLLRSHVSFAVLLAM